MSRFTRQPSAAPRMDVAGALQVLAAVRRDSDVVVTNQASARLWPTLSDHPLDLNYNPSTMGGAIPLAVGLALAQPRRQVMVVTGEGSLLMSLGALVTLVASGATNVSVIVLNNGMYEVTGGQATPATDAPTDFAALARAAGVPSASHYTNLAAWSAQAAATLANPGPRLVCLEVGPTDPRILQRPAQPIKPRLQRLGHALAGGEPV